MPLRQALSQTWAMVHPCCRPAPGSATAGACSVAMRAASCWCTTKACGASSPASLFYKMLLSELPSSALGGKLCSVPGDLEEKSTSI